MDREVKTHWSRNPFASAGDLILLSLYSWWDGHSVPVFLWKDWIHSGFTEHVHHVYADGTQCSRCDYTNCSCGGKPALEFLFVLQTELPCCHTHIGLKYICVWDTVYVFKLNIINLILSISHWCILISLVLMKQQHPLNRSHGSTFIVNHIMIIHKYDYM